MVRILGKLLVITVCSSLVGCTSLRPVTDWQLPASASPPRGANSLKPGDHITVTTRDGQKAEVVFVALTADALEGTAGKGKQLVQIPRDQISRVERQEISALKTAGLTIAVALLVLTAVGISEYGAGIPGP